MMLTDFFSPAQCVGYLALLLGVCAFLQRQDHRLKRFNACQSLAYALHFFLLGNAAAAASSLVSSFRSFAAVRTRSLWLAGAVISVNLLMAFWLVHSPWGLLPILAACLGTYAMFRLTGLPLRLTLLLGTVLWFTNNLHSGSIGGTVLESFVGVANLLTIARMLRHRSAVRLETTSQPS